jgi:hypothetical protein
MTIRNFAGYATLDRPGEKGSTAEHIAAQPGLGEAEWPMLFVPARP